VLQGFATSLAALLAARLALGVAEAPAFPSNSRVLSAWFPQHERARATSAYAIGQYFGLAFLSPLLFWISSALGWRALFALVGTVGVLFGLVWLAFYRDPRGSGRANPAELQYIASGGGFAENVPATRFAWRNVAFLLRQRQVLGASIGQFASNCTLVFFLTWFPTYLATERHMQWIQAGFFAVLPFIAATLGVVSGGAASDWLLRRTGSANLARKAPVICGLVLATSIVAANYLRQDALVIAVMSLAFFGQGMCNLGFTLITDVAPKELIGLTAGVFNLCANLAGIVTPLVIGLVVARTGSFVWALGFVAAMALAGALSYLLLLGDVRRLELA
jgi:MFS transporter, ACS family, D-galactonate transporter